MPKYQSKYTVIPESYFKGLRDRTNQLDKIQQKLKGLTKQLNEYKIVSDLLLEKELAPQSVPQVLAVASERYVNFLNEFQGIIQGLLCLHGPAFTNLKNQVREIDAAFMHKIIDANLLTKRFYNADYNEKFEALLTKNQKLSDKYQDSMNKYWFNLFHYNAWEKYDLAIVVILFPLFFIYDLLARPIIGTIIGGIMMACQQIEIAMAENKLAKFETDCLDSIRANPEENLCQNLFKTAQVLRKHSLFKTIYKIEEEIEQIEQRATLST